MSIQGVSQIVQTERRQTLLGRRWGYDRRRNTDANYQGPERRAGNERRCGISRRSRT